MVSAHRTTRHARLVGLSQGCRAPTGALPSYRLLNLVDAVRGMRKSFHASLATELPATGDGCQGVAVSTGQTSSPDSAAHVHVVLALYRQGGIITFCEVISCSEMPLALPLSGLRLSPSFQQATGQDMGEASRSARQCCLQLALRCLQLAPPGNTSSSPGGMLLMVAGRSTQDILDCRARV